MSEQEKEQEQALIKSMENGGFDDINSLHVLRRIISERDIARTSLQAIRDEVQQAFDYWTTPPEKQRVSKIPTLTPGAVHMLRRLLRGQ